MTMPSFTGDATLYRTSSHYSSGYTPSADSPPGEIAPAMKLRCYDYLGCALLESYCDMADGGMSSEPDGGLACNL